MKKILVAMNNEVLLEQLKKSGKYLICGYDIDNKENVIEYLEKNDVDVLITKDVLEGAIEFKDYIRKIKDIKNDIKIIVAIKKLSEDIKGFLLANDVVNIIEGDGIGFSKIMEMIESKKGTIEYNTSENTNVKIKNNVVIPKQKICVFGTSGAGKSYVSSALAHYISKKHKLNTLLIDMDLQNAAIDIYNNLDTAPNSLGYLMEEIDNNNFNSSIMLDYISKGNNNSKLSFLTNNVGIYECQNKLGKKYYEKLYEESEKNYDMVIIDLPSSPFLDVVPFSLKDADKILFVLNPNFISIRQAVKYIDLMVEIWQIDKEKIHLVLNKVTKESLSNKQVLAILRGLDVAFEVNECKEIEKIINGISNITDEEFEETEELLKILNLEGRKNKENNKNGYKCIQNYIKRK